MKRLARQTCGFLMMAVAAAVSAQAAPEGEGSIELVSLERSASITAPAAVASGEADYWVLTLAWSPEFCRSAMEFRAEPQCAEAHGFLTSRLEAWHGDAPVQPCTRPAGEPSADMRSHILGSFQNRRWAQIQWNRQGGCAGLEPDEYFIQADFLGGRVEIPAALQRPSDTLQSDPEQVRNAFVAANPTLPVTAVGVQCELGWLSEVRICIDRDHQYRDCPAAARFSRCGDHLQIRALDPHLRAPTVD